jgi:hypothetical protein
MVYRRYFEISKHLFVCILFAAFTAWVAVGRAQIKEQTGGQKSNTENKTDAAASHETKKDVAAGQPASTPPQPLSAPAQSTSLPQAPYASTPAQPSTDSSKQEGSQAQPSTGVETPAAVQASTGAEASAAEASQPPVSGEDAIGFGESASDNIGFGEGEQKAEESETSASSLGNLTLNSFVRSQAALWSKRFNDNPWAKIRQNLDTDLRYKKSFDLGVNPLDLRLAAGAHLEYDFAYLYQRNSYNDPMLDTYEYQIIGRETSIGLTYEAVELTFGRQIVGWGEGVVLSPLDVVNPQDLREIYLVDLVDRRLATLATKLEINVDDFRLETIVVHESYFGLRPPPMGDFSYLRKMLDDDPRIASVLRTKTLRFKDEPGRWVYSAAQLLERWTYSGHGIDLSLYAASILEQRGVSPPTPESRFLGKNSVVDIDLWHPRYTMLGFSGSAPVDDIVLKWEVAFDIKRPFTITDTSVGGFNVNWWRYSQVAGMLGFQYQNIIEDANLIFEYEQHYVFNNPARDDNGDSTIKLQLPVEQPQFALVWKETFFQERLSLDITALLFGIWEYTGWMAKVEVGYELTAGLKASIGYATFQPNKKVSSIYGTNKDDRILATLRWDFLLE